jgi:hypothetical protein
MHRPKLLDIASLIHSEARSLPSYLPQKNEIIAAARRAEHIWNILRSEEPKVNELRDSLDQDPINALTLLGLLALSRRREADIRWDQYESAARNDKALTGMMRAYKKHSTDPRQDEKEFIKECWKDWKIGKTAYKSKADFARDMLEKTEHLKSQKKIEDWCRQWEKYEIQPS